MNTIMLISFIVMIQCGLIVVVGSPIVEKAECKPSTPDGGEKQFWTVDGYRKCSTSCDRKTKMFTTAYNCECCFDDESNDGDKKDTPYKTRYFTTLVTSIMLGIALFCCIAAYVVRRKMMADKQQGDDQQIVYTQADSLGAATASLEYANQNNLVGPTEEPITAV